MKCRSVACIWSDTPPSHHVTAATVLNHPPTLYTGGSDGSIFWWNLSGSNSEFVKPVAMLCGHAAPIAGLSICYPVTASGHDSKLDNCSNGDTSSSVSESCGALLSASVDAVLCVWSRGSGHCRCRRKLPPWVGSPSIIRTLPCSSRYVCIGCCFVDGGSHVSDRYSVEGIENLVNKEGQHKRASKCSVVIVDTYSLTIVQTVFHGNLSVGPLKFMDVVLLGEDGETHSVLLADSYGMVQLVPVLKDVNHEGEGGGALHRSPFLEVADWGNGLSDGVEVVSIASCRNLIALVLKNSCIFRLLTSGTAIGEISFTDTPLCAEGSSIQSHVLGGIFLGSDVIVNMHSFQDSDNNFSGNFAVWNSEGSVMLYALSYLNAEFHCQLVYEIPAASRSIDARVTMVFLQLNHYLLQVESVCVHVQEPLQWKPHITIWSLDHKHDGSGKSSLQCQKLEESHPFANWISSSNFFHDIDGLSDMKMGTMSYQSGSASVENDNHKLEDHESHNGVLKGQTVSSSMVISENFFVPYAVVYGYFSGKIEVVHFDLLLGLESCLESRYQDVDSPVSRKCFSGHTGAVLCLAAHRMFGTAEGRSFRQVLVSGSMDCTIRIWDLDTGNQIMLMHQHVAPVRQIIFPPPQTAHPWSDCFLSVGEDSCVALASLETLRVERMFPGHPSYLEKVVWDGSRGYIACICRSHSGTSEVNDVLYIWDVKTGSQERVLRGTASHSMLDHFCKGISVNSMSGSILNGNTSVSSLLLPIIEDGSLSSHSQFNHFEKRATTSDRISSVPNMMEAATSLAHSKGDSILFSSSINKHPITCTCPFPGIATLTFDLASLMFSCLNQEVLASNTGKQEHGNVKEQAVYSPSFHSDEGSNNNELSRDAIEENSGIRSLEIYLLRFSLSFLHVWDLDEELDRLLIKEMKLNRPENLIVASGLQGDKGSLTLTFPGLSPILELWKSSSEFSAMRSLTMVSISQRMISLSHSCSAASSALAAFYTRKFTDKFPDIKPPLLQLLVGFWQDESEHVRMAARTLFHCAASRAIPTTLCGHQASAHAKLLKSLSTIEANRNEITKGEPSGNGLASDLSQESPSVAQSEESSEGQRGSQEDESKILAWLESFEVQDWISCVGGTSQDAMTSHIIIAAALAIWYPSLVKPSLAMLVVHPLIKLVMAMNEKYSSTAAELLAEGMESTWKACNSFDITRLIADILFQVECVSGQSASSPGHHPSLPSPIRETLIGTLLPSLAMADIPGFLAVTKSQIWSTASDSPVHLVSLRTLIRVVRDSPRHLAEYLDKVVNFILHTMDPGNSVMRKNCLHCAMAALKEIVRAFPMVALNDMSTRLAVGDVIRQINNATISVYDMQSVTKVKVLDASGPPGLPNLLSGASETGVTTVISALSFSPDGEGLVAFSEHGLMIRWWSLGSAWWEKLSRNLVPVQCTKLIFVPPWEGFSPNPSRTSIMASVLGHDPQVNVQEIAGGSGHMDSMKLLIHNLDLSYRLEWVDERKVLLTRHGQELGTFPL